MFPSHDLGGREGGASGIADDDKVIAAASAILEAKKKGRDTIPFDLALEMTGDPDKAYEALGLAFRKFALDQQESDALAREKAKQKEVDPAKAEAKEVIKESLAAQGQSGDDFLDSIEIDFNLNDLFPSHDLLLMLSKPSKNLFVSFSLSFASSFTKPCLTVFISVLNLV